MLGQLPMPLGLEHYGPDKQKPTTKCLCIYPPCAAFIYTPSQITFNKKFKTLSYPVFGRNKNIILIFNYFLSFQCFHNMSKQLLVPGGLTELSVFKLFDVNIRPWASWKLALSASRASEASNVLNLSLVM